MTITRLLPGNIELTIVLTEKELFDAYLCQQSKLDLRDTECWLNEMTSDPLVSAAALDVLEEYQYINELAVTARKNLDKHGGTFEEQLSIAFEDFVKKNKGGESK